MPVKPGGYVGGKSPQRYEEKKIQRKIHHKDTKDTKGRKATQRNKERSV
jgi:hypothetical protein